MEAASHRRGTTIERQEFQDAAVSNRQLKLGLWAARLSVSLLSAGGWGGGVGGGRVTVNAIRSAALITFVPPEWRGGIRRVLRC